MILGQKKSIEIRHEIQLTINSGYVKVNNAINTIYGVYYPSDLDHTTNLVNYQVPSADGEKTLYNRDSWVDRTIGTTDIGFIKKHNIEFAPGYGYVYVDDTIADDTIVAVHYTSSQRNSALATTDFGEQMIREPTVYGHIYTRGTSMALYDGVTETALGDTLLSETFTLAGDDATLHIPLYYSVFGQGDDRPYIGNSFNIERVAVGFVRTGGANGNLQNLDLFGERSFDATANSHGMVRQISSVAYTDTAVNMSEIVSTEAANNKPVILAEKGKLWFMTKWTALPDDGATDWFELKVFGKARG